MPIREEGVKIKNYKSYEEFKNQNTIWKPIVGYEDLYEISNFGEVRGVTRMVNGRYHNLRIWKGVIIQQKVGKNGYCTVRLYKDRKYQTRLVHILVATTFIPNPSGLPEVNHKDRNKENNCVSNLEWAAKKKNGGTLHAARKSKGEHKGYNLSEIKYNQLKSETISKSHNGNITVTQDDLINQVAAREDTSVATVRQIFDSAENIIFDYLSSTSPSENVTVKLFSGLSLEGKYIPERELHTYDDIVCKERIRVRPKVTRYYNRKINQ